MPKEIKSSGRSALHLNNLEMNRLTKEALCGALLLLMGEKDYAAISITELAARAGVSRNGFYRNYASKDDIVKDIIFSFNQSLYESIGNPFAMEDPYQWYNHFFQVVRKYADTLKPLMVAGFRGTYLQITNEYIISTYCPRNIEEQYLMLAWNGAIQNITFDWIDNGMETSEDQMSRLCSRLLPQMEDENAVGQNAESQGQSSQDHRLSRWLEEALEGPDTDEAPEGAPKRFADRIPFSGDP